jgi:hypothetical protein
MGDGEGRQGLAPFAYRPQARHPFEIHREAIGRVHLRLALAVQPGLIKLQF